MASKEPPNWPEHMPMRDWALVDRDCVRLDGKCECRDISECRYLNGRDKPMGPVVTKGVKESEFKDEF